MPLPAGDAIRRRDHVLARTRLASRWITAAAIAASVGIGGAGAHALPRPHPPPPAAAGPAAVSVAEPAGGRVGRLLMTALWYATRGTGVVALLLLTATVALGIAATARFATPRWPRLMP